MVKHPAHLPSFVHNMAEKGVSDMAVSRLCAEFARILGATPSVINGVCTASTSRLNIRARILGRRTRSFLSLTEAFTFESMDKNGRALCLGETVILQSEIQRFISVLRRHGIRVTALHNHWLFDSPRLMFIHFEAINRPLVFARHVREALDTLIKSPVG